MHFAAKRGTAAAIWTSPRYKIFSDSIMRILAACEFLHEALGCLLLRCENKSADRFTKRVDNLIRNDGQAGAALIP